MTSYNDEDDLPELEDDVLSDAGTIRPFGRSSSPDTVVGYGPSNLCPAPLEPPEWDDSYGSIGVAISSCTSSTEEPDVVPGAPFIVHVSTVAQSPDSRLWETEDCSWADMNSNANVQAMVRIFATVRVGAPLPRNGAGMPGDDCTPTNRMAPDVKVTTLPRHLWKEGCGDDGSSSSVELNIPLSASTIQGQAIGAQYLSNTTQSNNDQRTANPFPQLKQSFWEYMQQAGQPTAEWSSDIIRDHAIKVIHLVHLSAASAIRGNARPRPDWTLLVAEFEEPGAYNKLESMIAPSESPDQGKWRFTFPRTASADGFTRVTYVGNSRGPGSRGILLQRRLP